MEELVGQAEKAATSANDAADRIEKSISELNASATDVSTNAEAVSQSISAAASAATGGAIDPFVFQFAIFVMAIFVGYYVVWSVTPALHTPLMAVTNAISSVIVVGALLAVGIQFAGASATLFGFIALVLASVNIFGGFLVTQRMLAMYKKKER
ncbi:MAG: NAD(P) transhydrogenase subunit alpha [Pseudomonadota bacterium]